MQSLTESVTSLLSSGEGPASFWQVILTILGAYLGGVLASLTPCVYPMIPITVSMVGGLGQKDRSWKTIWIRGLAYVGGMTVVYSFLGVLAGLTGKVFGSYTNTSGWYLFLALVLTLSSLIMLDVVPFNPEVWWEGIKRRFWKHHVSSPRGHGAHARNEMTMTGAFTLGASSGLIAAPCTTPVLSAILAFIAKTQSVGLGLALMFSFSFGLGTLLLLIAGFAGAIRILPRSGNWLKMIKVFSGLVLLGFAEYLVYRAGQLGDVFK